MADSASINKEAQTDRMNNCHPNKLETKTMSYTHNDQQTARDEILALQDKVSEGRREFFKQVGQGAVATAVATTAVHMGVRPYMKPIVSTASADPISMPGGGWKNLFSLKPNFMYLNIGTTGSTPTAILDKYEQWYYDIAWRCDAYQNTVDYCIDAVSASGNPFGCNPSEFVMTFTTTDGMMKLMDGQDWKAGDRIIITNMEHGGGLGPMYASINRYGVDTPKLRVVWVDKVSGAKLADQTGASGIPAVVPYGMVLVPTGVRKDASEKLGHPLPSQVAASGQAPDRYFYETFFKGQMDSVQRDLGGHCQAMMISSPPYLTGVRLPEAEMCAYTAERGIRSTIDGAHLTGMINLDFHKMGVDFFAGSGHKWQCGPGQTGIAYIRNGTGNQRNWKFPDNTGAMRSGRTNSDYASGDFAIPKFWPWNDRFRNSKYMVAPADVTPESPIRQFWHGHRDPAQNAGRDMQSIGNNSAPLNRALFECINLWNTIGRANVEDYVVTLAQYLRFRTATNPTFEGDAGPGAGAALFGHVQDFRKNEKGSAELTWADVWTPAADGNANMPVWTKCGLTGWNPIYWVGEGKGPDYNRPMSPAERTQMSGRTSAIIAYLNATHGIYTRNTAVPHQMRFDRPATFSDSFVSDYGDTINIEGKVNSQVILSANANAGFGTQNNSQPFRISTHLFHNLDEVEMLNDVFTRDANLAAMLGIRVAAE